MKTVIVTITWEARDDQVIGVGARLATRLGADLRFLRAAPGLKVDTEIDRLRRLAANHGLLGAQVAAFTGESTVSAIVHACRRSSDSVLVLATGEQPCAGTSESASVADQVVRRLDDPLMLVGPLVEDRGEWSGIVVLWDGSFASAAAVPVAAGWAHALGVPLHLVHVRAPGSAPLITDATSNGTTLADRVVRAATVDSRGPVAAEIVDDDPAAAASRFCRSFPGNALVVLAALGETGPPPRALGRFTLQLAGEGPHALLVCHYRP